MASSIIITGASGSLGGKIAFKLNELYPKQYHFVLAARNTSNESANDLSALLHSASAKFTTVDGFDVEYQTNTLAPVLLMQKLAPLLSNGVVINVSSSTHGRGNFGKFNEQHAKLQESTGNILSTTALLNKYGSTKLILMMAGYAIQRDASFTNVQIVAADPGGMHGGSRLALEGRVLLKFFQYLFLAFRSLIMIFLPSAINPPEAPTEAIAKLINCASNESLENFYVLDKPTVSSGPSNDQAKRDEALSFVMEDPEQWI